MDLSICIVSYNCRDLLAACLRTIEATAGDLSCEVIVTDNASGDGTVQMLAEDFPHVQVIANGGNAGFAGGTNQAMARATGDVLLMLNPDTEVRPGALTALVEFVRSQPDLGAVGPRLIGPDGELQLSCHAFPTVGRALIAQLGLHRLGARSRWLGAYDMTWSDHAQTMRADWLSGAAMAIPRDAWEAVGPLDEHYFMYFEDVDWCYRAARAGYRCWYLPEAEVVHYEGASWADMQVERVLAAHRANFRFFRKNRGRAVEICVRALVAGGTLLRGIFWTLAWPFGCRVCSPLNRPAMHLAVLREALAGRAPGPQTKA